MSNKQGKEAVGNEKYGALCIRKPWPGIARTIYGDHKRFMETYMLPYPGMVLAFL